MDISLFGEILLPQTEKGRDNHQEQPLLKPSKVWREAGADKPIHLAGASEHRRIILGSLDKLGAAEDKSCAKSISSFVSCHGVIS